MIDDDLVRNALASDLRNDIIRQSSRGDLKEKTLADVQMMK
jgi:hypothetical protein